MIGVLILIEGKLCFCVFPSLGGDTGMLKTILWTVLPRAISKSSSLAPSESFPTLLSTIFSFSLFSLPSSNDFTLFSIFGRPNVQVKYSDSSDNFRRKIFGDVFWRAVYLRQSELFLEQNRSRFCIRRISCFDLFSYIINAFIVLLSLLRFLS